MRERTEQLQVAEHGGLGPGQSYRAPQPDLRRASNTNNACLHAERAKRRLAEAQKTESQQYGHMLHRLQKPPTGATTALTRRGAVLRPDEHESGCQSAHSNPLLIATSKMKLLLILDCITSRWPGLPKLWWRQQRVATRPREPGLPGSTTRTKPVSLLLILDQRGSEILT